MTRLNFNLNYCIEYLTQKRKQMNCIKNVSNQYQSHACAIIDKKSGQILGTSYNRHYSQNKTHYGTIHAEDGLIRKYENDSMFKNKKLYLIVVRINGRNSKPCSDCIFKLSNSNLKFNKIFYTNVVDGIKGLSFDNMNQLINDPDMHMTSYYKNKNINCMCNHCQEHDTEIENVDGVGDNDDDDGIDCDEDDDEAKR